MPTSSTYPNVLIFYTLVDYPSPPTLLPLLIVSEGIGKKTIMPVYNHYKLVDVIMCITYRRSSLYNIRFINKGYEDNGYNY